ncbi:hypothetical protein NHX12_030903 [Muraenolepis orangiensis]|uniref:IkappaB kinase n=1 Tax=Muraenolepis orangiensis TaxID=630683 RepID=A0A9Q0IM32_9TELE|nr:hypothetical protein NHX12_030903 [Muraenolepis orangiensis]
MTSSTKYYLWTVQDVLGHGATATVYKARNKKTGDVVAVKVFNQSSYNRSHEVQIREFEMLRRLNHNNIVRLFAVEEFGAGQKVLVMEYCSGGNLLSLLEEPKNAFGLPEMEFLIVLQCVVQGMNHLRENRVVHRDIKPGNIMCQMGEDGRSVYKLTDFGAARELGDEEKFVSIYGTEEYLHPDMYKRAVLRKPQQTEYGVTVDLWSIGVTFYQVATGSLPFMPYGGPRKNKPTMHKITTQKPVGSIAGMQRVEDGPIDWGYNLPASSQLSQGLASQLVPVLAGILEADQERCWSFDQFFMATTDILKREPIHVFSVLQATASCIYIHHHNTVSMFLEEVASQTGMVVEKQQLLYLGHELPLEGSMKVVNLPPTTASNPLLLLGPGPDMNPGLLCREPETPVIPSRFNSVADYRFSKAIVGLVHLFLRIVQKMHDQRGLLLQGYYSYMMKLRRECETAMVSITMVTLRLQTCLEMKHKIDQYPSEIPGLTEYNNKLQLIREQLPIYVGGVQQFENQLEHLLIEQAKLAETLANDKSLQKMRMLLEKITEIHQMFRKNRQLDLGYNDEQIHKFEKIHLSAYIKRIKSLFRDDSVPRYNELLAISTTWTRMHHLKEEMEILVQELECNNSIIESLGAVSPAVAALEPSLTRPSTL